MNSNLYYKTPLFFRGRWEEKIVNELSCPLYKIVNNEKFYGNDNIMITVNSHVTIVIFLNETDELRKKVKNTLRK